MECIIMTVRVKESQCQCARESVSAREEHVNSEKYWCLRGATYANSEYDSGFQPASYTKAIQTTLPMVYPCSSYL